jgi:hypothetical protein
MPTIQALPIISWRSASEPPTSQCLIASDPSVETASQLAKLYQGIRKGRREVGSRFAVQNLSLD